jgi:hypothetical protein
VTQIVDSLTQIVDSLTQRTDGSVIRHRRSQPNEEDREDGKAYREIELSAGHHRNLIVTLIGLSGQTFNSGPQTAIS